MNHRTPWTLLILAGLGPGSACGYEFGYRTGPKEGLDPVRSVAVDVVRNATFRQGFEAELTRAVVVAVQDRTPLQIRSSSQADAVLEVRIEAIEGRLLINAGRSKPVREGALEFAVRTTLRDSRTGRVIRERNLVDRAEFATAVGETERSARNEAMADLGRKIALALEPDF